MITALYASLLAIWLVFLSFRVIALRGSPVFAFLNINTDDDEMLQRAIRAHGNLTEYAPMMVTRPSEMSWVVTSSAVCRLMTGSCGKACEAPLWIMVKGWIGSPRGGTCYPWRVALA